MQLETLTIRGVLAFGAEATLDARELPAGLIALVGGNGQGKTTALEAPLASLYRSFPTREKQLVDYANERDAFLETTFALAGRGIVRARVTLDGPKRESRAVLEMLAGDSRTVLNDGKLTTYDAAVASIFPPRELMLASAFAAQNRSGSFITLDKQGRRSLFARLLGLDRYESMATTASAARGLVEAQRNRLLAQMEMLSRDADVEALAELRDALTSGASESMRLSGWRETTRSALASFEAELNDVQTAAAAYGSYLVQRERMSAEMVALERARADHDAEVDRIMARSTEDIAKIEATRDGVVRDIDERLVNNQTLLNMSEIVAAAVAAVARIDAEVAAARSAETMAIDAATAIRRDAEVRADALRAIDQQASELAHLDSDARLLGTVPCHGAGEYASCQFLTRASSAANRIPVLREAVSGRATIEAEMMALRTAARAADGEVESVRKSIAAMTEKRAVEAKTAALQERLLSVSERVAELQARRADAMASAVASIAAVHSRHVDDLAALERRSSEREARMTSLHAERVELDAAIAMTAPASERATVLRVEVARVRRELQDAITNLATCAASVAQLTLRVERAEQRVAELSSLNAQVETLNREVVEWQLLGRMLGREGLPTLEIDAAGPTVSALTNEQLTSCYGSRFTVELITQEEKRAAGKDGSTHKEVFSIRVFDNEKGGAPRDITDLSGGQQVVVDEALKNALAILVNQRQSSPMLTCWRDETTGSLDPEAALHYVTMLRHVQQRGGFRHVFFVTHNQDAALLADAQVRVHDGQFSVSLPPFSEAPHA